MSKKFENKVALVTGGSTGIGRSIARRLAEQGATVVITGRNEKTLVETASTHPDIEYVVADVSTPADVERTLDEVRRRHDRLDVLVNNAGIAPIAPLAEAELGHFDQVFDVNVRGLLDTTRQSLPLLKAAKGNVVNIASVVGNQPMEGMSVYSASKAAVIALSKAWARELAPEGVRVNVVNPGPIETPLFEKTGLPDDAMEELASGITAAVPLGRFGSPEEVASVVAFIASDDASYVTGTQYEVSGGMGV